MTTPILVLVALAVPLATQVGWEVLSFSRVPPNRATFSSTGLRIDVVRSAGPIVLPLSKPMTVSRVRATGRVEGALRLPLGVPQGSRGADDYVMRVGLVEAGTRRLGRFERLVAPAWVKRLYSLAPADQGIAQVRFLNVARSAADVGNARRHPLSELFYERVVTTVASDGRFVVEEVLADAPRILAVWLSADGDDTGSTFSVVVEGLELD